MTASVQAPTFYVKVKAVGEQPVRLDLGRRLLAMEYEDNERKADRFRMIVDNWDLAHFDDPIFKKGNKIEVSWGYDGNMAPPREVIITKIRGFEQLEVEGLDKSVLMNKNSHQETYANMTRADVARIIAERNGYGGDQQYIQPTDTIFPEIRQARLTDAQMLRKLAHKEGFEFYIDFDGFHFHERVMEQAPMRTFTWYNATENRGAIKSIEVKNDVYAKPARVRVKSIDPATKQEVEGVGSNDDTDRAGTGELAELFTIEGKEDDLEFIQLQASDWERPEAVQGGTGEDETKKQADRRFRKATQTAVKMDMTVIGDAAMIAKVVVRVEGVGKRLTGNYYLKVVKHSVSSQGFETFMSMISDGTRGYVRISDVLLDDKNKQKKKTEEPESKADVNAKEGEQDLDQLFIEGVQDDIRFVDKKQRQNLPAGAS